MPPTAALATREPQLAARVRLLAEARAAARRRAKAAVSGVADGGRGVGAAPARAPAAARRRGPSAAGAAPPNPRATGAPRPRAAARPAPAPGAGAAAGGFVSAARVADRQSRSRGCLTATLSTAAGDDVASRRPDGGSAGGMCEPSDVHLSDASVLHFSESA